MPLIPLEQDQDGFRLDQPFGCCKAPRRNDEQIRFSSVPGCGLHLPHQAQQVAAQDAVDLCLAIALLHEALGDFRQAGDVFHSLDAAAAVPLFERVLVADDLPDEVSAQVEIDLGLARQGEACG